MVVARLAPPRRRPHGPLRAPGPAPGPADPGRRQGRPVRRPGRHAVDPPAPLREGDHLRRAAAGPDARPHPGRDPRAAAGAGRVAQPRGDRRQAAPLPDPADPPAELGHRRRQADRRAGVRLRRRRDPGRPDHAAGRLDRAGPGHPPRPEDRERRRRQALRAGLPRGQGPAAGPRHARAARQADGAGQQGPGRRRLAGRGRGQADPPGRRVQAGAVHRHRLVRARRRRRLRGPARQPARPAGRRPPRRADDRAGRRLDGDAAGGMAQEVRHARRPGHRLRERLPAVQPVAGRHARRAAGRAARDLGRRRLREGPAEPPPVRGRSCRWTRRRASTASCGPISARAWAGSTTSSGSASAASSPTTWASARRSRCWRSCSGGGRTGRPRGRRWRWCRARWSSTGCRRPRSSRRGCGCSTTPGPAAIAPRDVLATTT